MTASEKVILSAEADCALSFVIAEYQKVRFIPQDSGALQNELLTLLSEFGLFTS
jgi:hypothetical protein